MIGVLESFPALRRADLLAPPVADCLTSLPHLAAETQVAAIDPELADTSAFCAAYGVSPDASANCIVVALRRGERTWFAACVVLATTRADVNGLVRRLLDARKASFAAMDLAVALTGMEYGGITPVGLPPEWPVLVDTKVVAAGPVVIGSGLRGSKLLLPGRALLSLPSLREVDALGVAVG